MNIENPGNLMSSRREFVKKAGMAGTFLPFVPDRFFADNKSIKKSAHPICYFSKASSMAGILMIWVVALKEAGFDGADLTVRSQEGMWNLRMRPLIYQKWSKHWENHGISLPYGSDQDF